MKISIKKYLLYSSIFAIFTEAFFFNFIIDWKLLYAIIIINYCLLLRLGKLKINKYFALIMSGVFVHAIIVNLIIGIPPNYMFSQIIGITIIGTYYYNFIPLFDKEDIIKVYVKMCFYAAIIGYIFYFLNINLNDGRLQSIFKEPAHYVIVVIPACYYFMKQKQYAFFLTLFGTLILSNSSLGYIGCALMFIMPNISLKRMVYLVCLLPIVFGSFYYIYNNYTFFKMRVEETYESLNVINTGKFKEDTNLSSYALISNLFVAKNNITEHPFGTGIGSHLYMHNKVYLKKMRPPEYLRVQHLQAINATDANSLFTRIVSEMGVLGFLLVVVLMYKASKIYSAEELIMAQGIFIYFILKLFRDGHYFPPELYFFIWYFYYSFQDYNRKKELA